MMDLLAKAIIWINGSFYLILFVVIQGYLIYHFFRRR